VDPCALLTAQQRAELGLDQQTRFSVRPDALYGVADVPQCAVRGFTPRAITLGLSIVTSTGIELYTSGKLAAQV
jgi:hypothetical protein